LGDACLLILASTWCVWNTVTLYTGTICNNCTTAGSWLAGSLFRLSPNLTLASLAGTTTHHATHTHTRPLSHPSSTSYVLVGEGDAEGVDPPLPWALVGPDDRRIPDEHVFVRRRGRAASLVGCERERERACVRYRWILRERGVCGSSAAAGVIPGTTKDKDRGRGEDGGVARRRRWGMSVKGGGNGGRGGSAKDPIACAR
jgi:hypothetical protein